MVSIENKKKIRDIINKVSYSKCENLWESTLLKSIIGLTNAEILGIIMHIEMDFNIKTNASIHNVKHLRTVGDIYEVFNMNYEEPVQYKEDMPTGY